MVEEIVFLSNEGSGVAHLLQKRLSLGFSKWQLGHSMGITPSFFMINCILKIY